MLKIKCIRTGKSSQPSYRIKVMEAKKCKGKFVEDLGYYLPINRVLKLNLERYGYWVSHGSKPTPKVLILYKRIIETGGKSCEAISY